MRAITADRYHGAVQAANRSSSKPLRQSAFARLLERLQHARQLQADREIRRYRAILQTARDFKVGSRER